MFASISFLAGSSYKQQIINFILGIHDVIKIIHYYYTQMLCLVIYVYNKSTHNIWFSMMLSVTIIPPFTRQPLHDWHSKAMQ